MTVQRILNDKGSAVMTCRPQDTIADVAKVLADKKIGAVVVTEGDAVRGILSERDIVRAVAAADKKLISNVSVFDLFEGPTLGDGKKSIAVEVDIQPAERTLTDADLEALAKQIVENVRKKTGGMLRG